MSVGAVIVTHNSARTLAHCIKSLRTCGVRDIIVIDNNSADGTLHQAHQLPVQVVSLPKNQGFAAAANTGARRLRSQYIFFLNPDARVDFKSLEEGENYLNTHLQIGVLGCLLCGENGISEPTSFGRQVTPWTLCARHIFSPSVPTQISSVGWVSGGAMIVRRDVFEQLGGFDPSFFLYWEDVDLCRRMHEAGWLVQLDPQLRVLHERGQSLNDRRAKATLYDQSADRYFRKHYPAMIWFPLLLARRIWRFLRPQAL